MSGAETESSATLANILARLAEIEETLREILAELRRAQGNISRLGHN